MKTNRKHQCRILTTAIVFIVAVQFSALAATYQEDFNDGVANNAYVLGDAVVDSGSLRLTADTNSQVGTMIINDLAGEGYRHESFTATFDIQIGPCEAGETADGMCFCLADVPTNFVFGEDGPGTGLTVSFDTYDNGDAEAPAITIFLDGTLIADIWEDPFTFGVFVPVEISLDNTGLLNVQFDGVDLTNLATGYITAPGEYFAFGSRTGRAHEEHRVDNINITTVETPGVCDLTRPGDPIEATSTNYPADGGAAKAIDDSYNTSYRNFDKENSGFIVSPPIGMTIVTGIALTTASDAPECDPASVTIRGSLDGTNFVDIVTNMSTTLPDTRFAQVVFHFTNELLFASYQVLFPSLKDSAGADSMQVCEVALIGVTISSDVTAPGDPITGTSANYPAAESPANAIDNNLSTKYLNFDKENSGFTVTPSNGPTVVDGITLTTANDAPERDPASVTIRGSLDGSNFVDIVVGLSTPLPDARKSTGCFDFQNSDCYYVYEVVFPTLKDSGSADSMQIAEVELVGEVVPEPAALGLLASVALGAIAVLRRKS